MLKNSIKFFKSNSFLFLIMALAIVLRFWNLSSSPPALNWDEVSHGYNAYSILKTGKDEWDKLLPVIFRAYGDYKLPLYIYLTAVSEFFFGLTPFAVRFVSALAGLGTVVVSYFLVLELFKDGKNSKYVALITSFSVAVEPWSLFVSRPAFEANLALFLFTLGTLYFFKYIRFKNAKLLLVSFVALGLTVWTYNSYRIFTPLILFTLFVVYGNDVLLNSRKNKLVHFLAVVVISIFMIPMFLQLMSNVGQARYSWVQIIDQGTIAKIEEIRNLGGNRFIHNKVTYFTFDFFRNYLTHFSPSFLFTNGSDDYQFNVPHKGILYPIGMPFFYIGLAVIVLKLKHEETQRNRRWLIILAWILLSPIPSSLTREAPHVLRDITFLPVPMILTSLGISETMNLLGRNIGKKTLYGFYVALVFVFLAGYLKNYFNDYRVNYSQSWQYGYSQVMNYVKANYSKYDKIIITKKYGEPHEFLLFNLKWSPSDYISDSNLNRFYQSNWYWVDGFDKFYFVNDWEVSEKSSYDFARSLTDENMFKLESGKAINCHGTESKCLLITSPGNFPTGWKKLKTIDFLDRSPAFEVYEN